MKKKNGFTLIELIIASSLMLVVLASAFSMMFFGNRVFSKSTDEYDIQAALRTAVETTNQNVRYSSAVFTIPSTTFPATLTEEWNYFGLQNSPDGIGNEIVEYKWNGTSHVKRVIMPAKAGTTYSLSFEKVIDTSGTPTPNTISQNNLLSYTIGVSVSGASNRLIASELGSLNSQQVVDQVGGTGVAIAYRTDDRAPLTVEQTYVRAQVAMVLDRSGSMSENMDDISSGITVTSTKMKILQRVAKDMVAKLARQDNIDISLIPFSTNANYPREFINAYFNLAELNYDIDDMSPDGGTNTGDGLRRAYWRLYNNKGILEQEALNLGKTCLVSNYVLILSDGETTYYSYKNTSPYPFYDGEGMVDNSTVRIDGPGSRYDATSVSYSTQMVAKLQTLANMKPYVVGFINSESDRTSVAAIATAFGVEPRFATSAFELEQVFTDIHAEISADIWYLQGPEVH
jgi:prepilin-type N-terminal cleavage/methylation domain-containing protein